MYSRREEILQDVNGWGLHPTNENLLIYKYRRSLIDEESKKINLETRNDKKTVVNLIFFSVKYKHIMFMKQYFFGGNND
jgi:hypothetical protein